MIKLVDPVGVVIDAPQDGWIEDDWETTLRFFPQLAGDIDSSGAASPARRDGSIVAANGDPGEANT